MSIKLLAGDCREYTLAAAVIPLLYGMPKIKRERYPCQSCGSPVMRRGLKVKYCSIECRAAVAKGRPVAAAVMEARKTVRMAMMPQRIRQVATCRSCWWVWRPATGLYTEKCPHCGKPKDVRLRKPADGWSSPVGFVPAKDRSTLSTRNKRKSVLLLVGNGVVSCVRCGCDNPALLEINHKEGGGAKDLKNGRGSAFYSSISQLKRGVDDLELLCKPCNAVHALELKHGPLPFRVVWND
jgi:predicted RNA-binding Zn-ribbon protein involved in translation (DUF1610 family)